MLLLLFSPLYAQQNNAGEDGQNLFVTIKPLHGLVSGVMGKGSQPQLLVSGTQSPHDFRLLPSDLRKLNQADAIFYLSDHLEIFLEPVWAVLPKKVEKIRADAAPGLLLLPSKEAQKNGDDGQHHQHDHSEEAGAYDPHSWLDPENAAFMVDYIAAKLAELYPQNAALYRANAKKMRARLKLEDARIKKLLSDIQDVRFIVFHDAYRYFTHHYELSPAGIVTLKPHMPYGLRSTKQIRKQIQEEGIVCIFSEPQFSGRRLTPITEATSVNTGVLDPLGAAIPAGPEHYFLLLWDLADNLHRCLRQ